uniref:Inner membrane protein n=1 Tax=Globodera pallida TaxID=36090 RepID=A0A183BS29_GLOPA
MSAGLKHCFCGIPVQTAARVIAIVGIAFNALGIAFAIYITGPSTMMTALVCFGHCFIALLNALILAAQKWRKPKLYLPYLAVKGFFMLLGCLVAVFTLCLTIYVLITEGNSKRGIMGIAVCTANCVLVPFSIWIYRLVWLAYKEAAEWKDIKSAC